MSWRELLRKRVLHESEYENYLVLNKAVSDSFVKRVINWRPGGYMCASAGALFWLALRAGLQMVSVILLTRLLGANEYGGFVVVLALASFFSPLAGLGIQGIVLRDVSQNPAMLPSLLGTAIRAWMAASLLCTVVGAAAANLFLPSPPASTAAILVLMLGEVASNSGVEFFARIEQAHLRIKVYGAITVGLVAVRLAALAIFLVVDNPNSQDWMYAYSISGLIYLAFLYMRVRRYMTGGEQWRMPRLLKEGGPFVAGSLAFRVQAEFNKPVLAHIGYADAGFFNIAQRFADIVSLPLNAAQEALWPRVFSAQNPRNRIRVAVVALSALATVNCLIIVVAAPWLSLLLGEQYIPVVPVLQWLAFLPVLQILRNIGNVHLMATGKSGRLVWVSLIGAGAGMAANVILIGYFGLTGAIVAVYATELTIMVIQYVVARYPSTTDRDK